MAATVTGRIFLDTSRTGRYDAGKPGLSGVSIVLAGKVESRPAVTDANGDFSFFVDAPGVYTLYLPSSTQNCALPANADCRVPAHRGARVYLVTVTRSHVFDNATLPGYDFALAAGEGALPALPPLAEAGTGADISVQLALQPEPVTSGCWLSCAATVSNAGPGAASNVVLAGASPSGLGSVRYSACNGAAWGAWEGTVLLNTLAAGASVTVYLVGRAERCPAGGLTWAVSVSSATPDPVPENNTASITARVRPACLPRNGLLPFSYSPEVGRRWSDENAATGTRGTRQNATGARGGCANRPSSGAAQQRGAAAQSNNAAVQSAANMAQCNGQCQGGGCANQRSGNIVEQNGTNTAQYNGQRQQRGSTGQANGSGTAQGGYNAAQSGNAAAQNVQRRGPCARGGNGRSGR